MNNNPRQPPPQPGQDASSNKKNSLFSLLRRGHRHTAQNADPEVQRRQQAAARQSFWRKIGGKPTGQTINEILNETEEHTYEISESHEGEPPLPPPPPPSASSPQGPAPSS